MKIAVLKFGKEKMGGHSAVLVEMSHYCKEHNHELKCFSYTVNESKRKSWKYKSADNFEFDNFTKFDANDVISEIEQYDLLILMEPPTKAGTKEDAKIYMDIYKSIQNPIKWLLSCNIKLGFIKRTRAILEIIAESDIVSTHVEGAEWKLIADKVGKTTIKTPLFKRIDTFTDYFLNEDRDNMVLYAGRYENYKGPQYMPLISKRLFENDIKCKMIGIDRSPASFHGLLQNPEVVEKRIEVKPPYIMSEGYEEMSKSLFSFSPMNLDHCTEFLEFSQVEGIICGCIPIFHKNTKNFSYNGTKFGDIPYFAIWFDEENPDECIDEIIKVANDKELQKKYKGTAFKVIEKMFSMDNFTNAIETAMATEKNRCTVDDILKAYNWTSEDIEKYHTADTMEYFIKQDVASLESKKVMMITGKYGGSKPYDKLIENKA